MQAKGLRERKIGKRKGTGKNREEKRGHEALQTGQAGKEQPHERRKRITAQFFFTSF